MRNKLSPSCMQIDTSAFLKWRDVFKMDITVKLKKGS